MKSPPVQLYRLSEFGLAQFVHGCYSSSPEVAERAEYHVMSHPQTFPRGLAPDYKAVGTTLSRRGKTLFAPQASLHPGRPSHRATAVFGHAGGRLVVPNAGEREREWDSQRLRVGWWWSVDPSTSCIMEQRQHIAILKR